jgi:hypothetical protein
MAMVWRPVAYVHRFFRLKCAGGPCSNARIIRSRCGRRTCPDCRLLDYFRLRDLYGPALDMLQAPKLLTLTLRNVPILSRGTVAHLRCCMKKLWKFYGPRIRGGIYALEAVNTGRGWHVHAHAVIDADYLDQAELSRVWLRITGDSQIVHIRQAYSPQGALKYILKYLSKPPAVPEGLLGAYETALKGVRLLHPFGRLFGWAAPRVRRACHQCGGTVWRLISLWTEWPPDHVIEREPSPLLGAPPPARRTSGDFCLE